MRIGLIVNPNAGLGGAVGLKGTDGPDIVAEALRRGAVARAGPRARQALERFSARLPGAAIAVASGALGANWAAGLSLTLDIVQIANTTGTARDTRDAVQAMLPLDVIVFAGGDGTARDVASVTPVGTAILGIPCGVKMHSGVFAISPSAAGAMMADLFGDPARITWRDDAEVMDIDEAALRAGTIAPRLYGLARVPVSRGLMQAAKGGPRTNASEALASAATSIVTEMAAGTLYIIGPGTSAGAVMLASGETPSILGVDAMLGGKVVARDADAQTLNALAESRDVRIVLGVTGQQGFILGRGNQQISPNLVRRAGRDGLIVLATEDKLLSLAVPRLLVDTGDTALDAALAGYIRVRTAAGREMMMRIAVG